MQLRSLAYACPLINIRSKTNSTQRAKLKMETKWKEL